MADNFLTSAVRSIDPATREGMAARNYLRQAISAIPRYAAERYETAKGVVGAGLEFALDRNALAAALERAPKPFQPVNDQDMEAAMAFWNPGGMLGKIVWHGSPHKFTKFDASKIGTGEGAQAYGHGVYLADSPSVAKSYQEMTPDAMAPIRRTFMGTELQAGSPEYHAASLVQNSGSSLPSIRKEVQGWIDDWAAKGRPADAREVAGWKKTLEILGSAKSKKDFGTLKHEGSLYKADLPDEWIPKMLDWDKPLSQQGRGVLDALKGAGITQYADEMTNAYMGQLPPQAQKIAEKMIWGSEAARTGAASEKNWKRLQTLAPNVDHNAIHDIADWYGSKTGSSLLAELGRWGSDAGGAAAAEKLRAAGIPGIRYLDGGSRGAGQGSYNYVVFPGLEDQVKILERNGEVLK